MELLRYIHKLVDKIGVLPAILKKESVMDTVILATGMIGFILLVYLFYVLFRGEDL